MVGLTLGLCLLFTGLIFLLAYVIEDELFVNQVKVEQVAFERVIANADPQKIRDWQPSNGNIQRIDSSDLLLGSLPESAVARVVKRYGVHEYFDDDNAMFIASLRLPNDGASYYLIYDVKDLLVVRNTKRALFAMIGGLTLIITIVAVVVARRLTKATLAPVSRLSRALQNDDLDHVIIELANEFSEDEIGILTRELAKALERVRESAEREYQFNRGVSHELRSPIQVAQSATELLQLYADESDTRISKPIARLQRSVAEMNEIAEAFLWLASDRVVGPSEMCSATALDNTLTAVQASLPNHQLVIKKPSSEPSNYPLPNTVLSVVIRSLVRNAAIHGDLSAITIDMQSDRISVTNSVTMSADENKGFGMGLSIVQRICDRFSCQLDTQIESDKRYSVSIVFV
ncbi:MAG: signal transduction histidine kinase [Arenicella sp.]|jgi:signal transduction histidine kinase